MPIGMTTAEPEDIKRDSLSIRLAAHLKPIEGLNYTVFNTYTSKRCVPVVHKPRKSKPLLTVETTHNLVLFSPEKTPLLAIEVFTYLTIYKNSVEKLVYVSKADTTGLKGAEDVNVGGVVTEYLKHVCAVSIHSLLENVTFSVEREKSGVNRTLDQPSFVSETQFKLYVLQQQALGNANYAYYGKKKQIRALDHLSELGVDPTVLRKVRVQTKLVLFTRSEGQYLFPESMKNPGKHVLDGSQLLKWWLKNIDKVVLDWHICEKYLNILNLDEREIERYFPSSNWKVGNVYDDETNSSLPSIYNIPLLPDDPKGRFLEHLVVENRAKKVYAKRYWQELAIRQEFRFGATVGLIGVCGDVRTNVDQGDVNRISVSNWKQFNDLITSKDYHDKSDWCRLYSELENLVFSKPYAVSATWLGKKRHVKKSEPVMVNTLMCVRKKKKTNLVPKSL